MPKDKGYGSFADTFGDSDEQPYDSSSADNMAIWQRKLKLMLLIFVQLGWVTSIKADDRSGNEETSA